MKQTILTLVTFVLLAIIAGVNTRVSAAEIPQFMACLAPNGSLKVSYESGTHGIVGNTKTYTGKDAVYVVAPNAVTQCFCSENGDGIQTNWLKIDGETDITTYTNNGWIYVPSGSVWGLDANPYLAKNTTYSCKSSSSSTGGSSSSGGNSSNSSTPTENKVLGLASTGNLSTIATMAAAGIALITTGFILRRAK